jgi:hypothetical protein
MLKSFDFTLFSAAFGGNNRPGNVIYFYHEAYEGLEDMTAMETDDTDK